MQKQKQISNFLDLELKKINDKVLTLKYVHPIITSGPALKKARSLNAHPQTLLALKSRRQRPVHKNIQFISRHAVIGIQMGQAALFILLSALGPDGPG